MKILVVGINAANGYEKCEPIVGVNETGKMCQTGRRWLEWAERIGVEWRECEYRNCREVDGSVQEWVDTYKHKGVVITLGKKAERAMSSQRFVIALPHPSGLNRKLNDKNFVDQRLSEATRSLALMKELLNDQR